MSDPIHTPAQAIEAAAHEAGRLIADWHNSDQFDANYIVDEIPDAIRALADRIAPMQDVAGSIWAWHRHDGTLNARLWEPMSDAPSFFPGEEYVPASALTALSAQVAALTAELAASDAASVSFTRGARILHDDLKASAEAAEAQVAALTAQVAGAREAVQQMREFADKLRAVEIKHTSAQDYAADAVLDACDHIASATPAPDVAQAARTFPPESCTAWEDCRHDGVCHDPNSCCAVGPNARDMDAEDEPTTSEGDSHDA